jgi:hypothetical protein
VTVRALIFIAVVLAGCRGDISSKPPVHLNQNMDFQNRFEMQEENPFFADHRAMRPYVEGTVALDGLHEDEHLYTGKEPKVGKPGSKVPVAPGETQYVHTLPAKDEHGQPIHPDLKFLERGYDRFKIYCTPCHGGAGEGDGIVVAHGFVAPPEFWQARLKGAPIGRFFDVISNGAGNMPSYGSQIPVRDRWAIAAFLRVLQRRRNMGLADIPPAEAAARGWSKPK